MRMRVSPSSRHHSTNNNFHKEGEHSLPQTAEKPTAETRRERKRRREQRGISIEKTTINSQLTVLSNNLQKVSKNVQLFWRLPPNTHRCFLRTRVAPHQCLFQTLASIMAFDTRSFKSVSICRAKSETDKSASWILIRFVNCRYRSSVCNEATYSSRAARHERFGLIKRTSLFSEL